MRKSLCWRVANTKKKPRDEKKNVRGGKGEEVLFVKKKYAVHGGAKEYFVKKRKENN
jgi:hypothetical protein